MKSKICRFLARHRRSRLAAKFNKYLLRFHQGFENLDYNFETNGEAFLLQTLQAHGGLQTIFDVGANQGDWSKIASNAFPQAMIHSFEIVPATYRRLTENCRACANVHNHNLGLSDENGPTKVFFNPEHSVLATCVPGFSQDFHRLDAPGEDAHVVTGDSFCEENKITAIDFLKMDVEGFEPNVLRGFDGLLRSGGIKIIQFEYGFINASTHFLLKDFYDVLTKYDMKIGKIYPQFVDFREYRFRDENFYGPNYLAVHASMESTLHALN